MVMSTDKYSMEQLLHIGGLYTALMGFTLTLDHYYEPKLINNI